MDTNILYGQRPTHDTYANRNTFSMFFFNLLIIPDSFCVCFDARYLLICLVMFSVLARRSKFFALMHCPNSLRFSVLVVVGSSKPHILQEMMSSAGFPSPFFALRQRLSPISVTRRCTGLFPSGTELGRENAGKNGCKVVPVSPHVYLYSSKNRFRSVTGGITERFHRNRILRRIVSAMLGLANLEFCFF